MFDLLIPPHLEPEEIGEIPMTQMLKILVVALALFGFQATSFAAPPKKCSACVKKAKSAPVKACASCAAAFQKKCSKCKKAGGFCCDKCKAKAVNKKCGACLASAMCKVHALMATTPKCCKVKAAACETCAKAFQAKCKKCTKAGKFCCSKCKAKAFNPACDSCTLSVVKCKKHAKAGKVGHGKHKH